MSLKWKNNFFLQILIEVYCGFTIMFILFFSSFFHPILFLVANFVLSLLQCGYVWIFLLVFFCTWQKTLSKNGENTILSYSSFIIHVDFWVTVATMKKHGYLRYQNRFSFAVYRCTQIPIFLSHLYAIFLIRHRQQRPMVRCMNAIFCFPLKKCVRCEMFARK